MQRLKAKGMFASKKLQAEKVKAIALIVAFEAKKEEELAERHAEVEKEIVDNAPTEEVMQSGSGEEEPEDIGNLKKSRKRRGTLLRARAKPKGTLADKITKTATILGGLGIAAWFVKGIIEARINKGGN